MRRADQICAVLLLTLAFFLGFEARRLSYWGAPGVPGPGFLPFWLAVGLTVGAIGILMEGYRTTLGSVVWFPSRDGLVRVSVLACLTGAMAIAIQPLGMLLAVGLYLLAFLAIYTPGRWLTILTTAGGTPILLYIVFERWLKVPLPHGFLGF